MADPYYSRYSAPADRGLSSFPGYYSSEVPSLVSNYVPASSELLDSASEFRQREINPIYPRSYGLDNVSSLGVHTEPVIGGGIAGVSGNGYPSIEDPNLQRQRRDTSVNIPELEKETPSSLRNIEPTSASREESNILFVDGLPNDCTRREVGHLFRPFIGFKDIKVIHKEPRRSGDRAMVLCFVEFVDTKCAITAMKALQGYKFDDRKPDSPVLRIHFAQFPFRLPPGRDEIRVGIPR